jgi:hypothetical protein
MNESAKERLVVTMHFIEGYGRNERNGLEYIELKAPQERDSHLHVICATPLYQGIKQDTYQRFAVGFVLEEDKINIEAGGKYTPTHRYSQVRDIKGRVDPLTKRPNKPVVVLNDGKRTIKTLYTHYDKATGKALPDNASSSEKLDSMHSYIKHRKEKYSGRDIEKSTKLTELNVREKEYSKAGAFIYMNSKKEISRSELEYLKQYYELNPNARLYLYDERFSDNLRVIEKKDKIIEFLGEMEIRDSFYLELVFEGSFEYLKQNSVPIQNESARNYYTSTPMPTLVKEEIKKKGLIDEIENLMEDEKLDVLAYLYSFNNPSHDYGLSEVSIKGKDFLKKCSDLKEEVLKSYSNKSKKELERVNKVLDYQLDNVVAASIRKKDPHLFKRFYAGLVNYGTYSKENPIALYKTHHKEFRFYLNKITEFIVNLKESDYEKYGIRRIGKYDAGTKAIEFHDSSKNIEINISNVSSLKIGHQTAISSELKCENLLKDILIALKLEHLLEEKEFKDDGFAVKHIFETHERIIRKDEEIKEFPENLNVAESLKRTNSETNLQPSLPDNHGVEVRNVDIVSPSNVSCLSSCFSWIRERFNKTGNKVHDSSLIVSNIGGNSDLNR